MLDNILLLCSLAILVAALSLNIYFTRLMTPDFPRPVPLPVLGHVLQVPTVKTWKYFERLSKIYGPIFRLSLGGDRLLVLNTSRDAEELLGKRGLNYSSRKPLIYAGKYQSNKRVLILPYGETFKRLRAAFHRMLQPRAVGAYEAIQRLESLELMHSLVVQPENAVRCVERFAASLIFTLTYGKRLEDNGRDLEGVVRASTDFVSDMYPGAHLVDAFPVLDLLPDWCSPWRAEARRKHGFQTKLYGDLLYGVKARTDNGEQDLECFAARLLDHHIVQGLTFEDMAYVAGSAYEAGTDTTMSTMQWFLMASTMFPEAQMKAQAELDSVLGADGDTMPDFEYLESLPYCSAFIKELLRFFSASPSCPPHYVDADDEYLGIKVFVASSPFMQFPGRINRKFPDSRKDQRHPLYLDDSMV